MDLCAIYFGDSHGSISQHAAGYPKADDHIKGGTMSKCKHQTCTYGECKHPGDLSRRDWFAGMAMQGYLSSTHVDIAQAARGCNNDFDSMLSEFAYNTADKMIEQSDKE
jgi:hypothetical protein